MIPPINRLVWFLNIQYNKSKLIFLTFAKSLVSISSRFTAVCFKTSATLTEMVAIPAKISAGKHESIKPGTGIWNSHFFNGSLAEKKNTSWCFMIGVPPSMLKFKTTGFFMKLYFSAASHIRKASGEGSQKQIFCLDMAPFAWCNPRW